MPARRKNDPGWQRLQRERYGSNYWELSSENLHVAGDLVGKVLKDFGLEDSSKLADLQKAWPELVGATNAEQCRPGAIEGKTLLIHVDHHMWLNEMKRTLSPILLQRLKERLGDRTIRQLRFVITPEESE